jgi:copper chaperone NosL
MKRLRTEDLGLRTQAARAKKNRGTGFFSLQSSVLSPQSAASVLAILLLSASIACSTHPPAPAALDTRNDVCRSCRMPVSDAKLAAQLVAPGEEPKFFDDMGCLRDHLIQSPAVRGSVVYVADHRTGAWIRAGQALFTRCPDVPTPMGSHLLAHAGAVSRDADPAARGGAPVAPREIFGPAGPPGGAR